MNYDVLNKMILDTNSVRLKNLEEVLGLLYYEQSIGDDYEPFEKVTSLKLKFSEPLNIEGSKNDFHNAAVTCARGEDYSFACIIIEEGLKRYPYNVDLLADYLAYGLEGGSPKRCKEIFDILMGIKKRWNWRGYSFVIEYLKDVSDMSNDLEKTDKIKELLDELTLEYLEKIIDREEPYCSRFDYLQEELSGSDKITCIKEVLETAVENSILKRLPKITLRLADLYYDCGDIFDANEMIERCKMDSLEIQSSVNRTYVYLLSTLCKISLYYKLSKNSSIKIQDEELDSERVQYLRRAYEDFHVACLDYGDSRVNNLKTVIKSVVRDTGYAYPYDDIDID